MKMRFGRFENPRFRGGMVWGEVIQFRRGYPVMSRAAWFAVDSSSRQLLLVNVADICGFTLLGLSRYLERDEAIFILFGNEFRFRKEWIALPKETPKFSFQEMDLEKAKGFLVTSGRITLVNHFSDLNIRAPSYFATVSESISALFADD